MNPSAPSPDPNPGSHSSSHSGHAPVSRIELTIPMGSEWVRVARLTVAGVASRLPFAVDDVEDIKLAVTEAINNAIQHAPLPGAPDQTPTISIVIETSSEGLWVNIADEGRLQGALPAVEDAPASWQGELPEGGLGLMLIRSLMDEVQHESGPARDTVVKMFKRVPARGSSHGAPLGARRPPVVR